MNFETFCLNVNWSFQTVLFEEILAVIVLFSAIYNGVCHKSLFKYLKICSSLEK